MQKYTFLTVDIQNDFASKGGKHYTHKPSVDFLNKTLFPYLKENSIKVSEIISDYRQPRPGDRGDSCHPGSWGYKSLVPKNLVKSRWIKCMNSPVWVRKNIGNPNKKPGMPYSDPEGFSNWLFDNIGKPGTVTPVLFGLTIDCCVLSTLQELSWRGYKTIVLKEGVDHASGMIKDRDSILESPIPNWGKVVSWSSLKRKMG